MTGAVRRVRVLLVDDHAVVRAGYRLLLQSTPEIEVVAEADTGELAYRRFVEVAPDVVIVDLAMPGMGGLEAIRRIVARDSGARILVFSMHEDPLFVEHALAAGARGYIAKSSAPQALIRALKEIAAGRTHVDESLAQRLALKKIRDRDTPLANLSTREFEIFCLLAEGLSSSEIAKRLSLSSKTVANYSSRLKSKLEVGTMAELTRLAIRHGVVDA
jgi:DNA-binding NarL/FixJ family response regulator